MPPRERPVLDLPPDAHVYAFYRDYYIRNWDGEVISFLEGCVRRRLNGQGPGPGWEAAIDVATEMLGQQNFALNLLQFKSGANIAPWMPPS